jgi:hypothetical protein
MTKKIRRNGWRMMKKIRVPEMSGVMRKELQYYGVMTKEILWRNWLA